ncbi:MAG: YwmB family TATA-box binding protein [Clostridia bacterium]|nr:YwmB family TATA-box binding protein [Clostridia bacterium]
MRFVRFFTLIVSAALAATVCFAVKATNISRLSAFLGERTFYLDSASSQALTKTTLAFSDIFRVRGESVTFSLPKEEEIFVREVLKEYGAELLATESVCGVTSYYAYVPTWNDGVQIEEKKVNLHIAIEKERCAVGTPIIFGGF